MLLFGAHYECLLTQRVHFIKIFKANNTFEVFTAAQKYKSAKMFIVSQILLSATLNYSALPVYNHI